VIYPTLLLINNLQSSVVELFHTPIPSPHSNTTPNIHIFNMQLQAILITSLISAVTSTGLEKRQGDPLASCLSSLSSSDFAIFTALPTQPSALNSLTALATNIALVTPFCGPSPTGTAASQLSSYTSAYSSWYSQNSAWLSSQLSASSVCPAYSTTLSALAAEPTEIASALSSVCSAFASLTSATSTGGAAPTNMAAYAGAAIAGALGVVAIL
jgi:hypothetical protein